MKIGIVGLGITGSACKFGFEKLGHEVFGHDIKLNTKIVDLIKKQCEIIYICVPTPHNEDGSCDTSIVESVVDEVFDWAYTGIVAIRSTIPPGTTDKIRHKHQNSKICFVPEFLRERSAISDFVENNNILAIGTDDWWVYEQVEKSFGHYPKKVMKMSSTEAELLKYFHNCFGALRVVFANEFYEITKKLGAHYTTVKNGLLHSAKLPDIYLDVSEETIRGYSSICWNKDVPAIIEFAKGLGLDLPMLNTIPVANDKFKKTPFGGTREHY